MIFGRDEGIYPRSPKYFGNCWMRLNISVFGWKWWEFEVENHFGMWRVCPEWDLMISLMSESSWLREERAAEQDEKIWFLSGDGWEHVGQDGLLKAAIIHCVIGLRER